MGLVYSDSQISCCTVSVSFWEQVGTGISKWNIEVLHPLASKLNYMLLPSPDCQIAILFFRTFKKYIWKQTEQSHLTSILGLFKHDVRKIIPCVDYAHFILFWGHLEIALSPRSVNLTGGTHVLCHIISCLWWHVLHAFIGPPFCFLVMQSEHFHQASPYRWM